MLFGIPQKVTWDGTVTATTRHLECTRHGFPKDTNLFSGIDTPKQDKWLRLGIKQVGHSDYLSATVKKKHGIVFTQTQIESALDFGMIEFIEKNRTVTINGEQFPIELFKMIEPDYEEVGYRHFVPKNSPNFENIHFITSHLEGENPFGLVLF